MRYYGFRRVEELGIFEEELVIEFSVDLNNM